MRSSGMRRGLAVAAIAAVVAVGAPLAANANSINNQQDIAFPAGGHVTLYSIGGVADMASTKFDGQNTTVSLVAGGTSDIDTMRFQFSTDGGATWTNIGGVIAAPNDDGLFSREWNPVADSGLTLPVVGIQLRANGHSNLDGLNHPGAASFLTQLNSTFDTVAINPGSALGVWKASGGAQNIIVSGTRSAAGTVQVGIGAPSGFIPINTTIPGAGTSWKTVFNINGYTYNAPDQVALVAFTDTGSPESSDGEGFTLYDQVLTDLQITANPTNPGNPATNVPVTIKALDQFGKPIAGVNFSSDDFLGPDNFFPIGTTNVDGIVDTNIGTPAVDFPTQSVNDGTVQYVGQAGSGNQTTFDPALGDIKEALTLGQAFANDLVGSSVDGNAFDYDEQDANDIQVQVLDQGSNIFDVTAAAQDLTYHWEMTPFSGEPETGLSHTVGAEVNGLFDIPVLTNADFPDGLDPEGGTYELFASLSDGGTGHSVATKKVLTVKAGEADVVYDDPDGDGKVIAPSGTTAHVTAKLALEDGTGLPGRAVDVHYDLGTEFDDDGNTFAADATIVSTNPHVTNGSGGFTIDVEDISDPLRSEIFGQVGSNSAPTPGIGDWGPALNLHHGVDFVIDQVPAGAVLDVNYNNTTAGPAGTLEAGTVHLEDAFGDDLAGVQVDLSLDTGFFTSGFAAPAPGNYNPTPTNIGDTLTVSTNASGNAFFTATIGRDAGFDDDGLTDQEVSGEVDGVTDSDSIEWDSANPLNVSEIEVVRTPGEPELASTQFGVLFDIYAWDQFGNAAKGVDVTIECAIELGDDDLCPAPAFSVTSPSDLDDGGDAIIFNDEAGLFEYTAEAVNPPTDIYDGSNVSQVVNPTTTFEQEWYTPDPNDPNSTYTIDPLDPSTPVPVDEPITVTVEALDQEGNPFVPGLFVTFVRTSDADNDQTFQTDANGIAQYVFEGTDEQCGEDDTVTAVVRDGFNGPIVETLTTTITFEKCAISVSLEGKNSANGKRDILDVTATSEASLTGAPVHLMARRDGQWVELTPQADRVLTSDGTARFSVKDLNGRRITKYRAVVDETDDSLAGQSQVLRRR